MTVLVMPVGHHLGASFDRAGDSAPGSWDIRIGPNAFQLDSPAYQVWTAAHGDGTANPAWDRAAVERTAAAKGVAEPDRVVDNLLAAELLVEIDPTGESGERFAALHQVEPTGFGLGNTPDEPGLYTIGVPGEVWAAVDYRVYNMWAFSHLYPSLRDACLAMATERRAAGLSGQDVDPKALLTGFLGSVPMLVATHCAFVDRRS